jgi:hypothetical protein
VPADYGKKVKCNHKGKNKSRFLHCAPHDETVRRFGRNDGRGFGKGKQATAIAKANATATAKEEVAARGFAGLVLAFDEVLGEGF